MAERKVSVPLRHLTDRALLELVASQQMELIAMADDTQEAIDALKVQVASNTSVTQSVLALLATWADRIEAAKDDPEQIQAEVDTLRTNNEAIAAAVAANTGAPTT